MTGSHFVPGLLSNGFSAEMLKAIDAVFKNNENQIKLSGELQKAFATTSVAEAQNVLDSENSMADAQTAEGKADMFSGISTTAGAGSMFGMRATREGFLGLGGPKDLQQEDINNTAWNKVLTEGAKSEASSGQKPLAAKELTNNQMDGLRNQKFNNIHPEKDPDTASAMKSLKAMRGSKVEGDPIKRGEAYDDVSKALKTEREDTAGKYRAYNETTERRVGYINLLSQATASFGRSNQTMNAAQDRHAQAEADKEKTLNDGVAKIFEGNAQSQQQAAGNSSQTLSELARTLGAVLQANQAA